MIADNNKDKPTIEKDSFHKYKRIDCYGRKHNCEIPNQYKEEEMTQETDKTAAVLCNTRSKKQYVYALIQSFDNGYEENLGLYSKPEYAEYEKAYAENKYLTYCQYEIRKMRIIK